MMKRRLMILFMLCFLTFTGKIYAYETYKIGDEVKYNGEKYYVIENSDEDTNYLAVLKAEALTLEEVEKYADGIKENDSIGKMYFYNKDTNEPTLNYNETDIKTVVDNWAEKEFGNDLVNIDGYKARLMNDSDIANLGYGNPTTCSNKIKSFHYFPKKGANIEVYDNCNIQSGCTKYYNIGGTVYHINGDVDSDGNATLCSQSGQCVKLLDYMDIIWSNELCESLYTYQEQYSSDKNYEWINNQEDFWTMITRFINKQQGLDESLWLYIGSYGEFRAISTGASQFAVRPVVNVKKSSLGSKSEYKIGDEITYKGEKYNVLYDVNSSDNYVTMLKTKSLTDKQIKQSLDNDARGYVSFYSDEYSCHTGVFSGCVNDYTKSNIKNILEKWYENTVKKGDQEMVGKYKVRLLTTDELIDRFAYQSITGSINYLQYTEDTPEWIYSEPSGYWAMDNFGDSNSQIATVNKIVYPTYVYEISGIRPVIYINKCSVGDKSCQKLVCTEGTKERIEKVIKYKNYLVGDTVNLNGENYFVLERSSDKKSTLTLLKEKPISEELINKYTDNKYEDNNGQIPFYTGETCKQGENYNSVETGCINSFDKSIVKDVLQKWADENFDESVLQDMDGYNVRLLTTDELVDKYGFVVGNQGTDASSPENQKASEDTPEFLKNIQTWTMGKGENGIYNLSNGSTYLLKPYNTSLIVPIITVDKCAVDGGCYEEEEVVGCDPVDKEPESIVHVDNTLSTISTIGFILGGILIVFGISLLGYNYIGLKKKNKR